jgi:hypothetical protein
MRHAAARTIPSRPTSRAAQLTLGVITYAIAGLSTCLITLGSAITIWGLWQWLGVN